MTENTCLRRHLTNRYCHCCGSQLRDSIVHFGEKGKLRWPLNWEGAIEKAKVADCILCLGSSLKVIIMLFKSCLSLSWGYSFDGWLQLWSIVVSFSCGEALSCLLIVTERELKIWWNWKNGGPKTWTSHNKLEKM